MPKRLSKRRILHRMSMFEALEHDSTSRRSVDVECRPHSANHANTSKQKWAQQVEIALMIHKVQATNLKSWSRIRHGLNGNYVMVTHELTIVNGSAFSIVIPSDGRNGNEWKVRQKGRRLDQDLEVGSCNSYRLRQVNAIDVAQMRLAIAALSQSLSCGVHLLTFEHRSQFVKRIRVRHPTKCSSITYFLKHSNPVAKPWAILTASEPTAYLT